MSKIKELRKVIEKLGGNVTPEIDTVAECITLLAELVPNGSSNSNSSMVKVDLEVSIFDMSMKLSETFDDVADMILNGDVPYIEYGSRKYIVQSYRVPDPTYDYGEASMDWCEIQFVGFKLSDDYKNMTVSAYVLTYDNQLTEYNYKLANG